MTTAPRVYLFKFSQSIHSFVGSVALAGAEDGLWAIEGGNRMLVGKMLQASQVDLIDATVCH
jgi:hypothetical protein